MKKKFLLIFIIIICLLGGISLSIVNEHYPLNYLFNIIINRGLQINPEAQIDPERNYVINIWYYPLFKTVDENSKMENVIKEIKKDIYKQNSNINIKFKKLSFTNGNKKLMEAVQEGNAPDIYLNVTDNSYLNEKYQIPVEWYINEEEESGYYTVDWNSINRRNHLWGFPLFIEEQLWTANLDIKKNFANKEKLLKYFSELKNKKLFFNIYDTTLLRQLLPIFGIDNLKITEKGIDEKSKNDFRRMYSYLYKLREQDIITSSASSSMLKTLIEEDSVIAGPVNPWLHIFLKKKGIGKADILLTNLIKVYSLNVFRQSNYKGDDHTKAVMKVAKYISKNYATKLTDGLNLRPGYCKTANYSEGDKKEEYPTILQLSPLETIYWQEKIIPAWIEFWEKELNVEKVLEKF